jgi:hypothetical protein
VWKTIKKEASAHRAGSARIACICQACSPCNCEKRAQAHKRNSKTRARSCAREKDSTQPEALTVTHRDRRSQVPAHDDSSSSTRWQSVSRAQRSERTHAMQADLRLCYEHNSNSSSSMQLRLMHEHRVAHHSRRSAASLLTHEQAVAAPLVLVLFGHGAQTPGPGAALKN